MIHGVEGQHQPGLQTGRAQILPEQSRRQNGREVRIYKLNTWFTRGKYYHVGNITTRLFQTTWLTNFSHVGKCQIFVSFFDPLSAESFKSSNYYQMLATVAPEMNEIGK